MRAKTPIPTSEQIDAWREAGDLEKLQQINEVLAKRANQRFKELEKHDLETAAYKRAKYYISEVSDRSSGEIFSRKKTTDIDALAEDIKQEAKFLRSQTSTVTGEKKRRANIYSSLTKKKADGTSVISVPDDIEVPNDFKGTKNEYFKEKFLEFLDNDIWKDIKKYVYAVDSNILNEAGEAIAKGADIESLENAYEAYLRDEIDIFTMWDNWVKVE